MAYYSSHLNAVEVNYSGRRAVRQNVAVRWSSQTEKDFVFAFRGPKPITQFYRYRLRHTEASIRQFKTTLLPFRQANRLGPVLFQLPKTFTVDPIVLDRFLHGWPRQLRVSFEFRHPSWFTDNINEILRRHGAALCLAERDELITPEILTASFVYLRLRKSTYSPAALRKLAERLDRYVQHGDVFAFFRQNGDRGPFYARRILKTAAHVASP